MSPRGLPGDDPIAAVEAWRERGAARLDPVGFAVIESLARRAAAQEGDTRRQMLQRIDTLLDTHAALKAPVRPAAQASDEREARRVTLSGLSELVDRLGRSPSARLAPGSAPLKLRACENEAQSAAQSSPVAAPASRINALIAFKSTWSRLRAEQRLRQALAQVPATAGPLNSSQVMNRTLQAMRDVSPEYLDAFMLHIDTLLWLEQAGGDGLSLRAATPVEGGRRSGARAVRKV